MNSLFAKLIKIAVAIPAYGRTGQPAVLSKENTRHAVGWPGRSITVATLPVNLSMTLDQNRTAPEFPSKTRTIHLPGRAARLLAVPRLYGGSGEG